MTSARPKTADELALNIHLFPYDHGMSSVPARQRLFFRGMQQDKQFADLNDNEYTVPPVQPSVQELSTSTDPAGILSIWVGMRPSNAEDYIPISARGRSTGGGWTFIPIDPKALRVVVPMDMETTPYYALVDQDNSGLCSGFRIRLDEVFFFREYRTALTHPEEMRIWISSSLFVAEQARLAGLNDDTESQYASIPSDPIAVIPPGAAGSTPRHGEFTGEKLSSVEGEEGEKEVDEEPVDLGDDLKDGVEAIETTD